MAPRWFVYLNGFAMLTLGVALLLTRPRRRGDSLAKRYANFGTLWALLCCAVGAVLLGFALGYLSFPAPALPAHTPRSPFSTRHGP